MAFQEGVRSFSLEERSDPRKDFFCRDAGISAPAHLGVSPFRFVCPDLSHALIEVQILFEAPEQTLQQLGASIFRELAGGGFDLVDCQVHAKISWREGTISA